MSEPTQTDGPVVYGTTPDGSPRTSAYYPLIGEPPVCGPADHDAAFTYLDKITRALAHGGWTDNEAIRLRKLRRKWERRAFGRDPRFELVGTRDGRLKRDQEEQLRPRQRKARLEDSGTYNDVAALVPRNPQDQRSNRERRWPRINGDLPTGRARGGYTSIDPDHEPDEPEPGDIPLPDIPAARQYLIPGQDTKGHAHRIYCRVMPAHYRALCALERNRAFGFRTIGDTVRWCVDFGVRELTRRARSPQAISALAQVDAIREILLDEQYYQEFPAIFEVMTQTINRHINAGAETEAVRLIGVVRHQIEQMGEPYWRQKFLDELMRHYGQYLDGSRAQAVTFGDEETQ